MEKVNKFGKMILTEEEERQIRELYAGGASDGAIKRVTGIKETFIRRFRQQNNLPAVPINQKTMGGGDKRWEKQNANLVQMIMKGTN